MSRRQYLVCGLALILALCFRFYPTVEAGWVYEDANLIGSVQGAWSLAAPGWPGGQYRPLTSLTWWAQVNQGPQVVHATNIALHLLCGLLVGYLVLQLARSTRAAWVAAVVFLLHPLTSEAVVYAAGGRAELLALAGVLVACSLALGAWWGLLPWVLLLAVAGKEGAVVGWILVLLTVGARNVWFKGPGPNGAILAVNVVLVALVCWVVSSARGMVPSPEWVLTQSAVTVRMLWLLVNPVGQSLDIGAEVVRYTLQLAAFGFLALSAVLAWLGRSRYPLFSCGVLWVCVSVLPRLIVQPAQAHGGELSPHQFYMAFPGVAMMFAAGVPGGDVRPGGISPQLCEGEHA